MKVKINIEILDDNGNPVTPTMARHLGVKDEIIELPKGSELTDVLCCSKVEGHAQEYVWSYRACYIYFATEPHTPFFEHGK